MNNKTNHNGQSPFPFNPQASPFQSSHATSAYQPTPGFFNLTSISKNKSEQYSRSFSRLNSEARSTSSEQSSYNYSYHKKHKKEQTKLDELRCLQREEEEDVKHYERKKKKLVEDLKRIQSELKSCEQNLEIHKNKLNSLSIDIEREKKIEASKQGQLYRQRQLKTQQMQKESQQQTQQQSQLQTQQHSQQQTQQHSQQQTQQHSQQQTQQHSQQQTQQQSQQSQKSNQPPQQSSNEHSPSTCSINRLSLNSTSNSSNSSNVQSTINNVVNNLLNKKKEIEFNKYDYIFKVIEEVLEPKSMDANSLGTKVDLVITIKKLISKEEAEKQGLRYIVRGCIYDSTSLCQLDNLSFVKSYEFQVNERKKLNWDNSETSASKQVYPFDVTNYTRLVDFKERKINIICHLNQKLIKDKRIAIGVYLVKRLDFNETLELIRKHDIVRKKKSEYTKNQVTNSFDQSCGIQMDSIKIPLIDPLSKAKISWPCIGEGCEHIATFDGLTFMESNSKKFSWFCPICGKTIGYDQLFYDELIKEILKKVSVDCTAIAFDKLSNWMPLSEETNKKETIEDDDDCITLE